MKVLRVLAFIIIFSLLGIILVFKRIPKAGQYNGSNLEKKQEQHIETAFNQDLHISNDSLYAGWAKKNITPPFPVRKAGYGYREKHDGVIDSLFASAIVFSSGEVNVAILTLDVLITPKPVALQIRKQIHERIPEIDLVYFTALHSHHSIGEWHKKFTYQFVVGRYNPKFVEIMVEQSLQAIEEAYQTKEKSDISYAALPTDNAVRHSFDKKRKCDTLLRVLKIKKVDGEIGYFTSFAAHPTLLSHDYKGIAKDYPAALCRLLCDNDSVNFATFAAGGVGTQKPVCKYTERDSVYSYRALENINKYGYYLGNIVQNSDSAFKTQYNHTLKAIEIPFSLPKPVVKISNKYSLRGWVYNILVGKPKACLQFLQVGEIILITTPCDITGEFHEPLEKINSKILLTSFNGEYIGYVIKGSDYHERSSEAAEMNWFGPDMGEHFLSTTSIIIKKLQEK